MLRFCFIYISVSGARHPQQTTDGSDRIGSDHQSNRVCLFSFEHITYHLYILYYILFLRSDQLINHARTHTVTLQK